MIRICIIPKQLPLFGFLIQAHSHDINCIFTNILYYFLTSTIVAASHLGKSFGRLFNAASNFSVSKENPPTVANDDLQLIWLHALRHPYK